MDPFNNQYCFYQYDLNNNETRVWYRHFKQCIVRSYLDPVTNKIIEQAIPYGTPGEYQKEINDYFRYKLN